MQRVWNSLFTIALMVLVTAISFVLIAAAWSLVTYFLEGTQVVSLTTW